MIYQVFSEKEILKNNKELLELHKRCLTNYLFSKGVKVSVRKKFFILYDIYISEKNITQYFFRPIDMFVLALVTDRLDEISNYYSSTIKKPKRCYRRK